VHVPQHDRSEAGRTGGARDTTHITLVGNNLGTAEWHALLLTRRPFSYATGLTIATALEVKRSASRKLIGNISGVREAARPSRWLRGRHRRKQLANLIPELRQGLVQLTAMNLAKQLAAALGLLDER